MAGRRRVRLVVVGAGGNIGSHLVPHLARMESVDELVLVDKGSYEPSNVRGQAIRRRDVGRKKARVLAREVAAISPELAVTAIPEAVERLPRGRLRGDVVLACLDSRRARQSVNAVAVLLGLSYIDAGVSGAEGLARVDVYRGGGDGACLECAWDERDYADLEQDYPCLGEPLDGPPTNAASSLGALAASLAAIECEKLLAVRRRTAGPAAQVLLDAHTRKHYVTSIRRNPSCRLSRHEPVAVEPTGASASDLTLGEALALAPMKPAAVTLRVPGKVFVRALVCGSCGKRYERLRLTDDPTPISRRCRSCGAETRVPGMDCHDEVGPTSLTSRSLGRTLDVLGFGRGEIFQLSDGRRERHFELS